MADDPTMSNSTVDDSVVLLCDEIFNFETISGAFFILIFIFSVTGNVLLLRVLVIYENLKNVTNLFVLNVACSDLLFAFTLPFWAVYYLHHWVFGEFFCKFMTAAYFVGLYSSIILLTAMTVDRYMMLHIWPNRVRRQRYAVGACVFAWVIGIAASLGNTVNVKVETDWNNKTICEDFSEGFNINLGYYLQVSLLFFLPFAIIVFCYSTILKKVFLSSNRKRHKTTVVVVLCIVAAFFICWGPYNMLIFTDTWYEPEDCEAKERFEIAYNICRIVAFSHCCMNPLLYMLSKRLRKHLLHFLHCKNFVERRNNNSRSIQSRTSVFQNGAVVLETGSKLQVKMLYA